MTIDGATPIQACAIRMARLAVDGTTPAGAHNMWQHKKFVKVDAKPVYEAGEEHVLKTGCGELDVAYKARDLAKRWDLTVEITYPDPEGLELSTGGQLLVDTMAATVGYGAPALLSVPNPFGVSIEIWEKAVLVDAQTTPGYYRHAYPRCYLQLSDRQFQNKPNTTLLVGYAIENPNWGNGPKNDFTSTGLVGGDPVDTSRIWQFIRDNVLPTPLQAGYQATPTQV